MHISHLALVPDAVCSVLLELTDTQAYFAGNSRDARLRALFDSYRLWAEQSEVPDRASFRLFTSAILVPSKGKFPEPSQRILSATAARYLVMWCSSLLRSMAASHPGDVMLQLQRACVGSLATFEVLMAREGRVMSPECVAEFQRAYLVYRSSLNQLALQSLAAGKTRWYLRPKCHHLGHITYHLLPKNPRKCSNYCDEDFIHRTKTIAQRSHPHHMCVHTLERYAVSVCLRWHQGQFV